MRPGEWNRGFLPHYFGKFAPADFHHQFDAELHNFHLARQVKRSDIAPRGGAKSTWKTLAYPLRCVLEGWERYIAILSDSTEQANQQLRHIRTELESNALIAAVYPDVAGPGPEWNANRITLRNGCVIEAFGAGKKIRGRRNRSARPSLIIIDDPQSNADITSPALRTRSWNWITQEVIPAGDEATNFLAVGSALHRDAVAVRLGQLAGWSGHTYRAVHAWPDKMDLWAEFERMATNLADDNREATARAYYRDRAAEMDAGAKVYWPERWPLVEMMLLRATVGAAAFECEYQGVPGVIEGAEWPADHFERNDGWSIWFNDWPPGIVLKLQALDPSKGTSDKADYQAHVMLGLHQSGVIYLDADLRRESGWVERAIDIAAAWQPAELVVEVNNTMGLFRPAAEQILEERRRAGRPVSFVYTEKNNMRPKAVRIREAISDYLRRGQLRVRNTPGGRLLVEQLRDWPHGEWDDGPDSASTAIIRLQELVGRPG